MFRINDMEGFNVEKGFLQEVTATRLILMDKKKIKVSKDVFEQFKAAYGATYFHHGVEAAILVYTPKDSLAEVLFIEILQRDEDGKIKKSGLESSLEEMGRRQTLTSTRHHFIIDRKGIYKVPVNFDGFDKMDPKGLFKIGQVEQYLFSVMSEGGLFSEGKRYPVSAKKSVIAMDPGMYSRVIGPAQTDRSISDRIKYVASERGGDEDVMELLERYYGVNLWFLVRAAKIIRHEYGSSDIRFFGLIKALRKTGVSSLATIHPKVQRETVTHLSFRNMIAFLYGKLRKEDDFQRTLVLYDLIRDLWTKGMIRKEVDFSMDHGKSESVKLVSFSEFKNKVQK